MNTRRTRKPKSKPSSTKTIRTLVIGGTTALALTTVSYSAKIWDGADGVASPAITTAMQSVSAAITTTAQQIRANFSAQMTAMDTAVAVAIEYQKNSINSAVRVWTKQKSVTANEVALNDVNNSKKKMATLQAQMQTDRMRETIENKGSYGQGHKTCTVLTGRKETEDIVNKGRESTPYLVSSTVVASPGSFSDPYSTFKDLNDNHSLKYCTQSQANSGYCSVSADKQGWDIMTSTLFTPTVSGSDVYEAQNALINNMVGLPDAPIPKQLVAAPNASNYILLKQRKDAIVSPAIHSLKSIQSEFLGTESPDHGTKISPVSAINKEVARYLGSGDEYQAWNKTLVTNSERGVMKELLQVQALDLYLLARQYHANEREELLLSGIVAASQQLNSRNSDSGGEFRTGDDYQRSLQDAKKIQTDFTNSYIDKNYTTR